MDGSVTANYGSRQKATRVRSTFLDAERGRLRWAKQAAEDEDFYNGKHYTQGELVDMKLAGMMPIVVDRTSPIINAEIAIFTSSRPTFKALPRDDSDVKIAALWSDILTYIWQSSDGDSQYQQCVQDYFSKGAGYIVVSVDPYGDDGEGSIHMKHVPVWDVYPDPRSREIDLSDARFIIVSKRVSKSVIEFSYPDQIAKINRATSDEGPHIDRPEANAAPGESGVGIAFNQLDVLGVDTTEEDPTIRFYEMYEKIRVMYYKVIDTSTGMIDVYSKDEFDPKVIEGTQFRYMKIWRTRIKVTATVGDNILLYEAILPTDTYPVIPFFLHHNGSPFPRSDISILKGMQREVNKRRSIMIHNASMQSNFKVLAQHGAIFDKNKWETTGSQAGTILEYNQGYEEPKQWFAGQLPAAWFQLEQEGKGDMEYSVSVFSNMMGSMDGTPETYRGMLALEEAGQRKIKYKVQHANHSLRRLGRVMMHYAAALYTMPKVMRIAGETSEEYKEIYINQFGVDPLTRKVKKFNDISVGQYDIIVYDGTSMPTNRMALLNLYLEMYQMGIIDKVEVLKKTDITDRDSVVQRMGEVQQMQAQAAQLEESIKQVEGLNQTLRRQNQQLELHIAAMEGAQSIEQEVMRTEQEQLLLRARTADRLKLLNREAELALQQVKIQGSSAAVALKNAQLAAKYANKKEPSNGRKQR